MHLALTEEILKEKPEFCDGDTWQEKWKRALFSSFMRVDLELDFVPETVGSTSVVAVVFPTHIFVSNCGDSRAVLCRGKTPLALSVDHKVSNTLWRIQYWVTIINWVICHYSVLKLITKLHLDKLCSFVM